MHIARLAAAAWIVTLVACGGAPPPPPIAPDLPTQPERPLLLGREPDERPDAVPRSVKRLLAEKKQELDECQGLVGVVGDGLGRRRADAETAAVARELERIEGAIATWNGDSDSLDALVADLQASATRVGLLREKLRTAAR